MNQYGASIAGFFRNFFTPTEQNEMLPFGLGRAAFLLYFALAAALILTPIYMRIENLADLSNPTLANFDAAKVIGLVNEARIGAGMRPLSENPRLDKAADDKLANMFANQYFAHVSPAGVTPWDFFRQESYNFISAGENLAKDFTSAGAAQMAFMNSPTHRANILSPLYAEMGAAVEAGTLDGRSTILVAQYFGEQKATAPIAVQDSSLSVAAPAVANIRPVQPPASATAVLGAEVQPPPTVISSQVVSTSPRTGAIAAAAKPSVPEAAPLMSIVVTPQNEIKIISVLALFLLLIAFAFLIMRGGATPFVTFRTIFLILLFGYIVAFGAGAISISSITPNSASIIVVSQ